MEGNDAMSLCNAVKNGDLELVEIMLQKYPQIMADKIGQGNRHNVITPRPAFCFHLCFVPHSRDGNNLSFLVKLYAF